MDTQTPLWALESISADDVAVCASTDQEEATGHVSVRNLRAMFNKGAGDAEATPVKKDSTPKFPRRTISRGTHPQNEIVVQVMAADVASCCHIFAV